MGCRPVLPDLLAQIPQDEQICSVGGDGAYDTKKCHAAIAERDTDAVTPPRASTPSKLDQIQTLLRRPNGATITELITATGWQAHSLRGAMAGALKKRGLAISSERIDGLRRYSASSPV